MKVGTLPTSAVAEFPMYRDMGENFGKTESEKILEDLDQLQVAAKISFSYDELLRTLTEATTRVAALIFKMHEKLQSRL